MMHFRIDRTYIYIGLVFGTGFLQNSSACAQSNSIDLTFLQQKIKTQPQLLESVHATVHEVITVPASLVPAPKPNVFRWGNVPGTRDYDWKWMGDSIKISYSAPQREAIDSQILSNGKYYFFAIPINTKIVSQASFVKSGGGVIGMPDMFAFRINNQWLPDAISQYNWKSIKQENDLTYGPVVILDGDRDIDLPNNQHYKEGISLTLSVNNKYLIVKHLDTCLTKDGPECYEYEVMKFLNINGVPFPTEMEVKEYKSLEPNGLVVNTRHLSVENIKLNTLTTRDFDPMWHENMYVKDVDTNMSYRIKNGKLWADPFFNRQLSKEARGGLGFIISFVAIGLLMFSYLIWRVAQRQTVK